MIVLVEVHLQEIAHKVRVLNEGVQGVLDLSRMQVFLILACMFLGILPKQVHEDCVHMGELMTVREN